MAIEYSLLEQKDIRKFQKKIMEFYSSYFDQQYKESLPNSLCVCCATSGKEIIGALRTIGDNKRFVIIVDFWVEEKWRKNGIAGKILDKTLKFLKKKKIDHVYLTVDKKNKWLLGFYKKHNFSINKDVYLMEKDERS